MAADDLSDGDGLESGMRAAHAFGESGNHRGAVDALRRVLARHPEHVAAHWLLGFHLGRLGDHAEGESACRAAVSLDPNDAVAHRLLASTLSRKARQRRKALEHMKEAVRLAPLDGYNHYELGRLHSVMFRPRLAKASFLAACDRAPNDAFILANTAEYLFAISRSREAKTFAARAFAADPGNAAALTAQARAHLIDGRSADARSLAQAAVALDAACPHAIPVLIEAELCRNRLFAVWCRLRGWTSGGRMRGTLLLLGLIYGYAAIVITLLTVGPAAPLFAFTAAPILSLWAVVPPLILRRRIAAAMKPVILRRTF